jgi:nucleotide-binding universal stress UspA family protein
MEMVSAMQITLDISEDVARQFAVDSEGLSRAALEALAIEGARSGKLTTEHVRRLLGLTTYKEADGFLKHALTHQRDETQKRTEQAALAAETHRKENARPGATLTVESFHAWLDRFTAYSDRIPAMPDETFPREMIYQDHA